MNDDVIEQAYAEWQQAQREALALILGAGRRDALERSEGLRYLTRLCSTALSIYVENADPQHPRFDRNLDEHSRKFACDNPDTVYWRCPVSAAASYRLRGRLGASPYTAIAVEADLFCSPAGRKGTLAQYTVDQFQLGANTEFDIVLSAAPQSGNWIELPPDVTNILVRQTFADPADRASASLHIERSGGGAPPPLQAQQLCAGLRDAGRFVTGCITMFKAMADNWAQYVNTFRHAAAARDKQDRQGGDPDVDYFQGCWRLGADEALLIEFTPPPQYRFWSFMLANYWTESLNYRDLPNVAVNGANTPAGPDGRVRLIVAHSDPGRPGWVNTAGHSEGLMLMRWVLAATPPAPPQARVVKFAELRGA